MSFSDRNSGSFQKSLSEPSSNITDEGIPSSAGTPSVSFNKTAIFPLLSPEVSSVADDENRSPNVSADVEITAKGDSIHEAPAVLVNPHLSKIAELCADVSMMSVDGNVTFDSREATKSTPQKTEIPADQKSPSLLQDELISPLKTEIAPELNRTFSPVDRRSDERPPSRRTMTLSVEPTESFSTVSTVVSSLVLQIDPSPQSSKFNSTFDKSPAESKSPDSDSFDEFLTPTQDKVQFYKESTANKPNSDPLNRTYEKTAFPDSVNLNATFNKDEDEPTQSGLGTPDLDLRLDMSVQQGDTTVKSPEKLKFEHDEVVDGNLSDSEEQIVCDGVEKKSVTGRFKEKSLLKRRCSVLEMSLVSSPKRANSRGTPVVARRGQRSSLINFNESIAFDFSAAAKTAETNGGVADMGSFLFASSSGLPVAGDPFDLSMLEKLSSVKSSKEQFTRVSFIAMFDPIKVQETPSAEPAKQSQTPVPCRSATSSPLVKGFAVPTFAVQKSSCATQTDFVEEAVEECIDTKSQEEISRLFGLLQQQQEALKTYESVVQLLRAKLAQGKTADPKQITRLQHRLADEESKNVQLLAYSRSMESSMKSMLKMTSDNRETNELLRNTVEEQQMTMHLMNDQMHKLNAENVELIELNDQIQQQRNSWEKSAKTNEKNVTVLRLQLQAKESEIESLTQQSSIMKKDVQNLRELVKSMS